MACLATRRAARAAAVLLALALLLALVAAPVAAARPVPGTRALAQQHGLISDLASLLAAAMQPADVKTEL